MRKFTIAFLRNPRHAFLNRAPPPSLCFNTLASTPEAAEVGVCKPEALPVGALETRKANVGKAQCGSLHADKKARPTSSCKLNALPETSTPEAVEVGVLISMGALETRKANVRKAREPKAGKIGCGSLHTSRVEKAGSTSAKAKANVAGANSTELSEIRVLEAETAAQNAATVKAEEAALHAKFLFEEEKAIERSAFNATTNESIINAKKDLSEWAANLDLNTFKRGRQWEEFAYKLLDYGISYAHVKEILPKCRPLPCRANAPDSTLKHFTMLGMSHEEMGHAISLWPSILNISNNVFQSKVEFFEGVGIDRSSLGKIMHRAHRAINLSCSTLRRRCDFWKDYLQDVQGNALCTLISKNPHILAWNLQRTVKPTLAYLEELGFNKKELLRRGCAILGMRVKTIALKLKLLEEIGISDSRSRTRALLVLHGMSTLKLHARLHHVFASGFSFDQVQKILVSYPKLLTCSEDQINLRLSYAVNVMNLSFDMIAACPAFWGYSYEKRIKYRYEVLQELKALGAYEKNICLAYMVSMTDAAFSRRFIKRLQAYTKFHASSL